MAKEFAAGHWIIATVMLGMAVFLHAEWVFGGRSFGGEGVVMLAVGLWLLLMISHTLAGKLTVWEANYRGLRMPEEVVARALYYHAAHYVPVAAMGFLTVAGYRWLVGHGMLGVESAQWYLYLLCVEVIAGAAYLFQTYWIAMRSIRYANR
jgi:hypothetical protein